MAESPKVAGSIRGVLQNLLAPEFKSIHLSLDSLRSELGSRHAESGSIRAERRHSAEKLEQTVRAGNEKTAQAIRNLSEKLDLLRRPQASRPCRNAPSAQ